MCACVRVCACVFWTGSWCLAVCMYICVVLLCLCVCVWSPTCVFSVSLYGRSACVCACVCIPVTVSLCVCLAHLRVPAYTHKHVAHTFIHRLNRMRVCARVSA